MALGKSKNIACPECSYTYHRVGDAKVHYTCSHRNKAMESRKASQVLRKHYAQFAKEGLIDLSDEELIRAAFSYIIRNSGKHNKHLRKLSSTVVRFWGC